MLISKQKFSERKLVTSALRRLRRRSSLIPCSEVPMMGRSIDLAYIVGGALFAIEFKLHNWKKAIVQSYDYLLGADYAYICMPERDLSETMTAQLEEKGIGLIFYRQKGRWPFKEVIKARKSNDVWSVARQKTETYILENRVHSTK